MKEKVNNLVLFDQVRRRGSSSGGGAAVQRCASACMARSMKWNCCMADISCLSGTPAYTHDANFAAATLIDGALAAA